MIVHRGGLPPQGPDAAASQIDAPGAGVIQHDRFFHKNHLLENDCTDHIMDSEGFQSGDYSQKNHE